MALLGHRIFTGHLWAYIFENWHSLICKHVHSSSEPPPRNPGSAPGRGGFHVWFNIHCSYVSTNWYMGSLMLLQLDKIGLTPIGFS